jgi:ATP-dependent 26S proteasome regulatory subunit
VIRKTPIQKVNFSELAKSTFMWTGAELEKLVREASATAMDQGSKKVIQEHFLEALKGFEVNTNERMKRVQAMVQTMSGLENVNQRFLQESLKAFTKAEGDDSRIQGLIKGLEPTAKTV